MLGRLRRRAGGEGIPGVEADVLAAAGAAFAAQILQAAREIRELRGGEAAHRFRLRVDEADHFRVERGVGTRRGSDGERIALPPDLAVGVGGRHGERKIARLAGGAGEQAVGREGEPGRQAGHRRGDGGPARSVGDCEGEGRGAARGGECLAVGLAHLALRQAAGAHHDDHRLGDAHGIVPAAGIAVRIGGGDG